MNRRSIPVLCRIVLPVVVLLYACGHRGQALPEPLRDQTGRAFFTDAKDLVQWSNAAEETVKTRKISAFDFKAQRMSADMMALNELRGNTRDSAAFNEARSHYTDLLYFKLHIGHETHTGELLKYGLENAAQYNDRVQYCAFGIQKDFALVNGSDTLPCAIHEFERSFNVSSGLNFMVAFAKPVAINNDITLVYNDRLFGNGFIKFNYTVRQNEIPYLKIN